MGIPASMIEPRVWLFIATGKVEMFPERGRESIVERLGDQTAGDDGVGVMLEMRLDRRHDLGQVKGMKTMWLLFGIE